MSIALGTAMENGWRQGLQALLAGVGRDVLDELKFCKPSGKVADYTYEVTGGASHLLKGLVTKNEPGAQIHLTLNADPLLFWDTFHVTVETYAGGTKGGQHVGSYRIVRASQDEQDHRDITFKCIRDNTNFTIGDKEKKFMEVHGGYENLNKDMSLLFNFLLTVPSNAPVLTWV
jgi:hypothetical protein